MRSEQSSVPSENPQDLLLRLLNQPKPAQAEPQRASFNFASPTSAQAPETAVDDVAQDIADAELEKVPSDPHASASVKSPMRVFGVYGSDAAPQSTPFEPEAPAKPIFTYVNPFDKLEAASPRRTPVPRGPKSPTPKLEILKPKHGLDSTLSSDEKDQHTHKSRKLSPIQSAQPHETVAEAVTNLGAQVGQEVEEALAKAEMKAEAQVPKKAEQDSPDDVKEEEVIVSNQEAKEAPKEAPKAEEAVAETSNEATDVLDNWENAETEDGAAKDDDQMVTIYQLPMLPFASLTVQNLPERRATFRSDLFMDIARLKKEFDQIDRSLVSATKNFIVYALVKKGGFRIIRQDNGTYRQVFENHHERIFNVAMCTAGPDAVDSLESILGIGVNGSVFWTSLEPTRDDQFNDDLDTRGIVLPPSPIQDDNTSGGQLKTRAKPSSRHPDFFAIGRGKSIHIVWPSVAAEYVRGGKGVCQTEKYLKERSLKILTGKAGKDFAFSEDDTVIVSLDKAGRMRFWDIRRLTDPELGIPSNPPRQVEVSDTLLELHTTSPAAKSWPTSVFFFDKDKPFNKGIALRYVMVGMKQNHSFQLWDLQLGKAVQEINLPHEKESDAICSVAFHPKTGIMAVAHPTRNSIFFIHVSCPRYNLPVMSQAVYIGRIASKGDKGQPPLPGVSATAIMTKITEFSFSPKGQIRSLHMLNEPAGPPDVGNSALFELYVMHSKGVCTLRVGLSDLGLKKDGEPLQSTNAEKEGVVTRATLKPAVPSQDEASTGGETSAPKSTSDRSARETIKKESSNVSRQSMTPEAAMRASTLAKVESKQDAARAAIINGAEKPEKRKKKRATAEAASQTSSAAQAPLGSYAQAAQATPLPRSPALPEPTSVEPAPTKPAIAQPQPLVESVAGEPSQKANANAAAPLQFDDTKFAEIIQAEVDKCFSAGLNALYKRLDEDRRVANADSGAKQEAILRLVSRTLDENVEGAIRKMVDENFRNVLLPKMLEQTSLAVEKSVGSTLKSSLGAHLAKEVPESVTKALRTPQIVQALSESVAQRLASTVESVVVASTASIMNPAVSTISKLIEQKSADQIRKAHSQREADSAKISRLTDTVQILTETIQTMAAAQKQLQDQLTKLQEHVVQLPQQSMRGGNSTEAPSPAQPQQKSPEQMETEAIARLMEEGKYEEGTMRWLQSNRTSEVFNEVFVKYNPAYLSRVSPLLNLSTGAVVTDSLEQNLTERLIWLDAVLKNVDPRVSGPVSLEVSS
jgi:WD40 repeat protein